jgi:histidinol phosphatase-like enzyme
VKAVFVRGECLCEPGELSVPAGTSTQLSDAVMDSLRQLSQSELLTVVLDAGSGAGATQVSAGGQVGERINDARQAGIKVDAVLRCPHRPGEACSCWGKHPGFLTVAAAQLDLRLNECYLLCTEPNDVTLAQYYGCRPLLVIGKRTIGELYGGHSPETHDFPIARSLKEAVDYVLCEEDASSGWDHARLAQPLQEPEEMAQAQLTADQLPRIEVLSPIQSMQPWLALLPQWNRRVTRFLLVLIVGGVWLSLGIAYILTHLYRVQHFPAFVWYITLQFIPRPLRGALFIGTGVALVALSLRAFSQLAQNLRPKTGPLQ